MNVSRPSVHPVDEPLPATTEAANNNVPLRARVKDIQGMPGTPGGLILRLCQFISALASLSVMSSTSDFPSVTAFRYLVAAMGLQSLWSLALLFVDTHALLVGRNLHNLAVVTSFTVGDGITSTLSFAAASACAGITVLLGNDLDRCNVNHCLQFETATAMAFVSWFAVSPSFLLNFWSLATRIMDATTKQSSPQRRKSRGPNGAATAHTPASELNNEQVVQTLTRFLEELRSSPAETGSNHDRDE